MNEKKIDIIVMEALLEKVIYYGDSIGLFFKTIVNSNGATYLERIPKRVEEIKIDLNSKEFFKLVEVLGNFTSFSELNTIWKGVKIRIIVEMYEAVMNDNIKPLAFIISNKIFFNQNQSFIISANYFDISTYLKVRYNLSLLEFLKVVKRKIIKSDFQEDEVKVKQLYRKKFEKN